jgi:hypothetical protein
VDTEHVSRQAALILWGQPDAESGNVTGGWKMKDEREEKLPKWAQDLLREERMKAIVRFPDEPAPEPDFVENCGHARAPRCTWIYSENQFRVFSHWVGSSGYMYESQEEIGFGQQIRGKFWLHEDDARRAHLWRVCRDSAEAILKAMDGK